MIVRFFTIAGGNKTALVWDCASLNQHDVASQLLSQAEQVGFIEEGEEPTLRMMGDELCINALLAFAFTRSEKIGTIYMKPGATSVSFVKQQSNTEITLTLPYMQSEDTVLFETIGYMCTSVDTLYEKSFFVAQTEKHKLPAFGVIQYHEDGAIIPTIYVRQTDSLVVETACGSGSIATALITGKREIVQPTGACIAVDRQGTSFTVGALVEEVR